MNTKKDTKLKKTLTNDWQEKINIGKEIFLLRKDIYTNAVAKRIKSTIMSYEVQKKKADEIFFASIYDYWMFGATTEEEFYLDFIHKSVEEKLKYITHMDRLNYMNHLNDPKAVHILVNKYETYLALKEHYKRDMVFISGENDFETFKIFAQKHKEFVVKPVGLATSIGVEKIILKTEDDIRILFYRILNKITQIEEGVKWSSINGIVIEEVIEQGEELAKLHPASINSVRLTTIKRGDTIEIFYPVLRIGKSNNFLCSGAVGSILTGINLVSGITETDGFNELAQHYISHPDTGYRLTGIKIPCWKGLCDLAKSLAKQFDEINYIGWDFVWTNKNEWCVMEANENGEFLGQIAYRKGLKKEFIDIIKWKSEKEFWWDGKYDNQ